MEAKQGRPPGLRISGKRAHWRATKAAVATGYPLKSVNLTRYRDEPAMLRSHCDRLQAEMLSWDRTKSAIGLIFTGTFNSLFDLYENDPESSYQKAQTIIATPLFGLHADDARSDRQTAHRRMRWSGRREWFKCPACGMRAGVLYGPQFACRSCQYLNYPSTRQCTRDRAITRAVRLRRRLGGDGSLLERFPGRPKGMKLKTWWRLYAKGRQGRAARADRDGSGCGEVVF
jgi:hypothetical protein